jgi:biotin carboxyl carrier protein
VYPRYVARVPGNYPQPASTVPGMPMPDGSRQTGPQPALPPGAMHPHAPPHAGPPGVAYPQPPGAYPVYGAGPGLSSPGMGAMSLTAWIATRTPQSLLGIAGAIAAGCLALGLLIGALASGDGGDEAASAPIATRSDPAAAAAVAAQTPPPPAAAATGSIETRVKTVEHPVLAVAVAPLSGDVERVHVKAGGSVTTGQKLYTLRDGRGARSSESTVEAPVAGRIERRAARGDSVRKGDVLAQLVDPAMWTMVADTRSEAVGPQWSCVVSTIEGRNRAPCRVESVQQLGGPQSRVTATVVAEVAGWLQGGGQELSLSLAPPAPPTGAASPEPVAATAPAARPASSDDADADDESDDTEPAAGTPPERSPAGQATASSDPAPPLPAAMAPSGASGATADAGP